MIFGSFLLIFDRYVFQMTNFQISNFFLLLQKKKSRFIAVIYTFKITSTLMTCVYYLTILKSVLGTLKGLKSATPFVVFTRSMSKL